ncbi:MAG TPA: PhzF family phenazine biosynthesis protein [Dehalococcoidia bacterium]|nr:PhzF family phenazine biosynthesis protein [Dehalococcoidia bacterium]
MGISPITSSRSGFSGTIEMDAPVRGRLIAVEQNFYLLDVFAEGQYSGNQLAVFRNAAHIKADDMRRLAAEVHFSETAFIMSDEPWSGAYAMRVFTPAEEIPFSGHAVLGAAYVLQTELFGSSYPQMAVDLPCGRVNIAFTYRYTAVDLVWMTHLPPEYGGTVERHAAAAAVGLDVSEVIEGLPVIQVSTGMPFLMIPVRSRLALARARVDTQKYVSLREATGVRSLYLFAPETYSADNRFSARMFAPDYGIHEDAATGAGAGCLAAYVLDYMTPEFDATDFSIEQGYEIWRPSLLFARARRGVEGMRVDVGGRVQMVARGSFV